MTGFNLIVFSEDVRTKVLAAVLFTIPGVIAGLAEQEDHAVTEFTC